MSEQLPEAVQRSLDELLVNLGMLATGPIYIDVYPIVPEDPNSPYTADINNQSL